MPHGGFVKRQRVSYDRVRKKSRLPSPRPEKRTGRGEGLGVRGKRVAVVTRDLRSDQFPRSIFDIFATFDIFASGKAPVRWALLPVSVAEPRQSSAAAGLASKRLQDGDLQRCNKTITRFLDRA